MSHPGLHFWGELALAVVLLGLTVVVRNTAIRRRLSLSILALGVNLGLHLAIIEWPSVMLLQDPHGANIEKIIGALAVINALVTLLFNSWFRDRMSDRAPAIVQDAIIVATLGMVALFVFPSSNFLTGSAIAAAVVGFALQDTLGNAFAGLAIQIEKPFRVGHWITVGENEGIVTEVTWRATKMRTKAGNLIVLPNNLVAKEVVNNYSAPSNVTRLFVEVGATYLAPPNDVRSAIMAAMGQVPRILKSPEPDVIFNDFGASALIYWARFWIDDYEKDYNARDEVRTAIYYEFHRRGIEIPWPIQVEYKRQDQPRYTPQMRHTFMHAIARVPVLAALDEEAHKALAEAAEERLYARGEAIVHEGEPGASMFVVLRGRVAVTVGQPPREVAVIEAGGYFGEMSLLTGAPRTATVRARADCRILELDAETFREYVQGHPEVIDHLASAADARRRELDQTRAAASSAPVAESVSVAHRMRRFFGLS